MDSSVTHSPHPRVGRYGTLRVLQQAERIFITNEKKEMQEEMDLTGMFIAIDAGEVEGAVDPKTGKNITVGGADKLPKASDPSAVAPTAGARTRERGFPFVPACDLPCMALPPSPLPLALWPTLLAPMQAQALRPPSRRRRGCCACLASATLPRLTTTASGRTRSWRPPNPLALARPRPRPARARVRKRRRRRTTLRASIPSRTCSAELS